jgi:serine/threonine protein kinase
MSQSTHSIFAEGQLLAGKYRVERVLGQGGMGVVLAAQHIHLEERVAIKLMLAEAAFSSDAVARFVREARAAARLQSAHVAKVSDVGTLEDGRPYMVMEYLDGADLSQVLTTSGPLPVQEAVDYLLQASEAIAEAHSLGIVHRDLKPANLFVTRRRDRTPHVKVLDFGISKVARASQSATDNAMTQTSAMMGSPLYMSPEQMTSVRDVDGRSDIWALGVILFELLTGSPPFMGETLPEVCGLVIQAPAPLARSRRPDLPVELEAIIQRCLAKNPSARFQNVAELATALQGFASRHGRASLERILLLAGTEPLAPSAHGRAPTDVSSTVADVAAPATSVMRGTHAAWGDTKAPPPKRSPVWWVIGAGLVPLLGGLSWWGLRASPDVPRPESSTTVVSGAEPPPQQPPQLAPSVASTPPLLTTPEPSSSPPSASSEPAIVPSSKPVVRNRPAAPAAVPKPPLPVATTPKPPVSASKPPITIGGRL